MFFDSHCHLNNENISETELKTLVEEIENSKLDYVVDVGFDLISSQKAVKHAENLDWCYAAVGCHPHDADSMDDISLKLYEAMAKKKKVKAIGEIGLDFHYDNSDRDNQRKWFRKQIRFAIKMKKPMVIHSRDADNETMEILIDEGAFSDERKADFPKKSNGKSDARVLLHCYSGSAELAKKYVSMGATISIAGPVTFKNNKKTPKVVEALDLSDMLIETDSPYLSPEPKRGKKNKPYYVEYTAEKIASIKGMKIEEVAEITKKNAMQFFDINI